MPVTSTKVVSPSPATPPRKPIVLSQQDRDRVLQSPLVREVMDVFQARLVDIRPVRKPDIQPAESPEVETESEP